MKNQAYHTGKILAISILFTLSGLFFGCSDEDDKGTNNPGPGTPDANRVTIRDLSFAPATFTVNAGATVTWRNLDVMTHTVTSDTGIFDSGNISVNGVYSYTFTTPGVYPYHCILHPQMTGIIIVN